MGTRYVEVPVAAMRDRLAQVAAGVTRVGGTVAEGVQGREVVVDIRPPSSEAVVRVYTSFARGAQTLRACDADAVRVVVGVETGGRFHPVARSQKLLRTAPTNLPDDARVTAFLDRFVEAIRGGYRTATKSVAKCPKCSGPMALRKAKATGNEFLGCLAFKQGCRGTRPVH